MTKTLSTRPSKLIAEKDEFIAYQIDRAVSVFGIIIDNALQEKLEVEDGQSIDRYTLEQLLDDTFLLPRSETDSKPFEAVDGMMFDTI